MTESPHEILQPQGLEARPRAMPTAWRPGADGVSPAGISAGTPQEFETDDFAGQANRRCANIVEVLACAGARPEHLVRLTWYVTTSANTWPT
jgi:enamine deaminase RidA (YjgF/YER057c/UK114 family)